MKRRIPTIFNVLLLLTIVIVGILFHTTVQKKDENISTLNSTIAEKTTHIAALEDDVSDKTTQIETLNADVADKAAQIEALNANVANQAAQIETLNADVADKAAQIEALNANVANQAAQIEALHADVAAKVTQIETLNVQAEALQSQIASLRRRTDYTLYSDAEIHALRTMLFEIAVERQNAAIPQVSVAELQPVEGATLRELFPDVELAKYVRNRMGVASIDVVVTEEQLLSVTGLYLTTFWLRGTEISSLEGIGHLKNLKELYVEGDIFTGNTLPDEIGLLANLETLHIWSERITYIPETLQNCTLLKDVEMWTSAPSLPNAMRTWLNLEKLRLYKWNTVKEIPDWIGQFPRLAVLRIENFDNINRIPLTVCDLLNLKELYIECKGITNLPEEIGRLQKLETLSLSGCNIIRLPDSIATISTLKSLSLRNNPIDNSGIPKALFSKPDLKLWVEGTKVE